jgi:hypothetical protein
MALRLSHWERVEVRATLQAGTITLTLALSQRERGQNALTLALSQRQWE